MMKKLSLKHKLFPEKTPETRVELSRNLKHTAKDIIINHKNKKDFIKATDILDSYIDPDTQFNIKDMKYSKAKYTKDILTGLNNHELFIIQASSN